MIDPLGLPREIQELIPLSDEEIKTRLHQDDRLVEIFRQLGRNQVSHVEKLLADRFVHIIEEAQMDPIIKLSLIGLFENVGAIGTNLADDKLDLLIQRYTAEELVSNWAYFSQNNKDKTLLILAKRLLIEKLLHLLKNAEVDVNIFTEKREPFLQYVYQKIMHNQREQNKENFRNRLIILKTIIEKGADLEARNKNDQTLLERAIDYRDKHVLEGVVKLGANPNAVNKNGVPLPIFLYRSINDRSEANLQQSIKEIEIFQILIGLENIDLMATDSKGFDLFQVAAEKNDDLTINCLFQSPRISADDKNGYQLVSACERGDWEFALTLLKHSELNPNLKNKDGLTPLWIAYKARNLKVIKALLSLENIDPNILNRNGETLLITTYLNRTKDLPNEAVFRAILKCKRTDLNLVGGERYNLLHYTYEVGDLVSLFELLKLEKIDPNVRDGNGLPLLVKAHKKLQREIVFAILQHPRADVNTRFPKPPSATNFNNGVPFSVIAFLRNDMELLDRLMGDPRFDINAGDEEGLTLIHYAIREKDQDLIEKILRNKKLDPTSKTNDGILLFSYLVDYDHQNPIFKAHEYDPFDLNLMANILIQHPRLSLADRNGYRLWLALLALQWDAASEILKRETEINVKFSGLLDVPVLGGSVPIVRELLRRGAIIQENLLFKVCRRKNREMGRYIFDAGPPLNFEKKDECLVILNTLFPNWDWDRIFNDPILDGDELKVALLPDSSLYIKPSSENVNPLEYFLVYSDPNLLADYLFSLEEEEGREYQQAIQKAFPNQACFLELKTNFKPPEKPERTLPSIEEMTLENSIIFFKTCFGYLNFTDPKQEDYIPPERILDQGKKCTEAQMKSYADSYCRYLKDPGNSKFENEKKDTDSYRKLREKFRYVMHYFRKEFENLEKAENPTSRDNLEKKRNLDHFLMLMAASGNHCIIAKNDVLEEILDKAYGVAFLPTIGNQVAYILQRSRLWTIEDLFTNYDLDPPELMTHDMFAFMVMHREELGVLVEDLVEEDPFVRTDLIDPNLFFMYVDNHIPANEAVFLRDELQTKGSEISPELFKQWLSENVPNTWTPLDEILSDLEKIPEEFRYSYLYRNFSIAPTPEEMLELANLENEEAYKKRFREITEEVTKKYQINKKQIEDEINKMRASLVDLEDPERTELQTKINKFRMQLPFFPTKANEEIQERKINYLHDKKVYLPALEYIRMIKARNDIPVIREKLKNAPVEKQWDILREHHIPFVGPLEVLEESNGNEEEIETVRSRLANKTEEEKWAILVDHKIFHAHPKTPHEALQKYRSVQYANQAYIDGQIRIDRINELLIAAKQIDYA